MADGDEDPGHGLRLPWRRVRPPDEAFEASAPPPPTAPPAASAPLPARDPGPESLPDPIALSHSFEALLEALEGRFDRLDERLAHIEHGLPERLDLVGARLAEAASSAGVGPPARAVVERLERGFDRGIRLLEGRLERLEDRLASSSAATVEALSQVGSGGFAEESGAEAVDAVLDRRLDRLETLVTSFHETTMAALGRNVLQVDKALDASHAAVIDRLAQLAPADLVARLIQGVVTTCEMLDAELIDLKRLLTAPPPSGFEPGQATPTEWP